ncbi:hypothetical protein ACFE04_001195 [Oxalis oulophora]
MVGASEVFHRGDSDDVWTTEKRVKQADLCFVLFRILRIYTKWAGDDESAAHDTQPFEDQDLSLFFDIGDDSLSLARNVPRTFAHAFIQMPQHAQVPCSFATQLIQILDFSVPKPT